MKHAAILLAIFSLQAISGTLYLIDRDPAGITAENWPAGFDLYFTGRDFAIASGPTGAETGTRAATVLDGGFDSPAGYAIAHTTSPAGLAALCELGDVLFEREGIALVRLEGPAPHPFIREGVHFVQPLRRMVPTVSPEMPPMRGGYDDYVGDIVAAVSESGVQAYIQQLQDYQTRYSSTDSYDTAAIWVRDTIQGFGIDAGLQYFPMGSYDCENVVAEKPGLVDSTKIYIICGHLDSTSPSPYSFAPGADDNASGSAAVVEAARIMSGYNFKYTVRFICFGGEEQGLYGSAYYASQAASAGDDILGVVNLDMVLYGPPPDDVFWVPYNSQSTGLALALDAICDTYVPALEVMTEYSPGTTYSDHSSFWNNGYSAVLGIEQEVYSNPYYHQTSDILSNYMVYFPFGTNCIKGAIATVAYLAEPLGPTGTGGSESPATGPMAIIGTGANPAGGILPITLQAPAGALDLSVLDMSGRVVSEGALAHPGGEALYQIDISRLPDGVYLVRAVQGASAASARLVVLN